MTQTTTLPLFGLNLVNTTRRAAVDALLDRPGRTTAAFVNAHCVNTASQDRIYTQALRAADAILPDGSGISLAAKMAGRKIKECLNGTDLLPVLAQEAARRGLSVFLLGAKPGIAETAARNLTLKTPGLRIAGHRDGFFTEAQTGTVIDQINNSGADILLVAMGVPMQDVWLYRHRHDLAPRLAMGVGAFFDFTAGAVPRAPGAIRKMGMEWGWRLAMEPRRLFKRYVIGNPTFMARAARNAVRTPAAAVPVIARRDVAPPMTFAKRALDITFATAGIAALAPVFAGTALAVKLTSRGPVFFRQQRVGLEGEKFNMFKFRSMYIDAEARREALLNDSDRDSVCFKMKNDPRITPIGGFIRRYSLDELPQLLNVLKGEMSLVGPRPALPAEVAAYPTGALRRLAAVPGITGIWQVSGRADVSFSRMVAMDLAYARSKSLGLDLVLLALTVRAVVGGRGAY